MVQNGALGIRTARTVARILTFVADTSQIGRTIGVNDTFGTAIRRPTHIVRDARANRPIILHMANGVRTAR